MSSPLQSESSSPPTAQGRRAFIYGATGVVLAVLIPLFAPFPTEYPRAGLMAGVAALMAVWWVFEVLPLAVTSLLPIVLLPLLGIGEIGDTQ
ncbi:MAG: anion transporter, partial [Myxococcota bacterium]